MRSCGLFERRILSLLYILVIGCYFSGILAVNAVAQSAIHVLVNGEPITKYDIDQRVKLLRLTQQISGKVAKRQAIGELVDQTLQLAEAKRIGVFADDQAVEDAFRILAERVKLSPKSLADELRRAGVEPNSLKERLRGEISWTSAVRSKFNEEIIIEDAEIVAALRRKATDSSDVSAEYLLHPIIVIADDASRRGEAKKKAQAMRDKFEGCADGLDYARTLSGVVVLPAVRQIPQQMPPEIRKQVEQTKQGQLTPPQPIDEGMQLLAVCGVDKLSADEAYWDEAKSQLRNERGQLLARRYLRDLRKNAVIDYR